MTSVVIDSVNILPKLFQDKYLNYFMVCRQADDLFSYENDVVTNYLYLAVLNSNTFDTS